MARGKTFKIGKTLINISSRGIATKDTTSGEIKRHAFPWTKAPAPAQPEPQQPDYTEEEEAREEQEEYEGQPGYYGGAYPNEDYDDGYSADEPEYDGEDGGYGGEEDEEEQPQSPGLLGSSWFMWLMLIVLPPFGIWLLWRNNRYEITPRSAISAAAVVWFIIILIWLFSHIGGRDNTVASLPTATPSPTPTVETSAEPTETPTPTPDPGDQANANPASTDGGAGNPASTDTAPSPTPNSVGVGEATATPEPNATGDPTTPDLANATFVWSNVDGKNYHSYATCSNMTNAQRVTLSVALSRGQTACPKCWAVAPTMSAAPSSTPLPDGMYYARPDGQYYHLDRTCTGMKNAVLVSEAEAIARGQTACPTCVGSVWMTDTGTWYHSQSNCKGMKNARKVTITEAIEAGKTPCPTCMNGTTENTTTVTTTGDAVFYATDDGSWYHVNKTCQGMKDAHQISAAAAEQVGKTACPVCLNGNSGTGTYYATATGTWYHKDRTCQGMTNAQRVSLATAIGRGQTACPKCANGKETTQKTTTTTNTTTVTVNNTKKTNNTTTNTKTSDSTYYSTEDGKYFHKNADCSGMKNATAVTASQIAARGQTPCPKCIGTSGIYYSTADGAYYHSDPTCSGMKGATIVTLAMIRSRNQTACPKCIGGSTTKTTTTTGESSDGTYYATPTGEYYHNKSNCGGMKNAVKVTLALAQSRGQKPCPSCVGSVYSAGGEHYHKDPNCSGMKNAQLVTIQAAEKAGQTPCPKCVGGTSTENTKTDNADDDSTLYYYATENGKHYHRTATCSGMTGATKVSEATAKARGQTPCPTCIGTVYATENGDYYHSNPTCTGMKGAKLMTVDQAELSGKSPCPTCMGGSKADANSGDTNTKPSDGNDGNAETADGSTEVWVTIEGSMYHSTSSCSVISNSNPGKTRLDWAVRNGYTRCPTCNAPVMSTST